MFALMNKGEWEVRMEGVLVSFGVWFKNRQVGRLSETGTHRRWRGITKKDKFDDQALTSRRNGW